MFKKHFISILYANIFAENILLNVLKITQETRFDLETFFKHLKHERRN